MTKHERNSESLDEGLTRAFELAGNGEFEKAHALLADREDPQALRFIALLESQRVRETQRMARVAEVRHDLGNSLSIVRASLEGMLDGVVPITEERLERLLEILETASNGLSKI